MVSTNSKETGLPSIHSLISSENLLPKDQELIAHCNGPSYHGDSTCLAPNGPQTHGMSAISGPRPRRTMGHKNSQSMSSLPEELQSLSLQGPAQPTTAESQQRSESPAMFPPLPLGSSLPPPSQFFASDDITRRPQRTTHHVRSRSEFTQPFVPQVAHHYNLVPQPSRHSHHRRAASANTVDLMLNGYTTPLNSRAASHSPPMQQRKEGDHITNKNSKKSDNKTSSSSDRYICQYCQKTFSRPSSLRIHTYSHTGEKPFACPEPDCGRRFSVQSNMRRHLRVHSAHRLGRTD